MLMVIDDPGFSVERTENTALCLYGDEIAILPSVICEVLGLKMVFCKYDCANGLSSIQLAGPDGHTKSQSHALAVRMAPAAL